MNFFKRLFQKTQQKDEEVINIGAPLVVWPPYEIIEQATQNEILNAQANRTQADSVGPEQALHVRANRIMRKGELTRREHAVRVVVNNMRRELTLMQKKLSKLEKYLDQVEPNKGRKSR